MLNQFHFYFEGKYKECLEYISTGPDIYAIAQSLESSWGEGHDRTIEFKNGWIHKTGSGILFGAFVRHQPSAGALISDAVAPILGTINEDPYGYYPQKRIPDEEKAIVFVSPRLGGRVEKTMISYMLVKFDDFVYCRNLFPFVEGLFSATTNPIIVIDDYLKVPASIPCWSIS